jgi:hypothetical protein
MLEIQEKLGNESVNKKDKMTNMLEAVWDRHYAKFVIIGYWMLGLCNNFAYVIMLSAAHDILIASDDNNKTVVEFKFERFKNRSNNKYDCNELSTGTILLGKFLPRFYKLKKSRL